MKSREILNRVTQTAYELSEAYVHMEKAEKDLEEAEKENKWWYFLGPGGGLNMALTKERRRQREIIQNRR
ncbi:hypothetical protein ISS86_01690 [Candidatus Microgenomates bacterium]|nr:hypothetical protein [Candidatus Microgenomates bacterium]